MKNAVPVASELVAEASQARSIAAGGRAPVVREQMRPTRVITYAWGDAYIDDLLSLTIPALLAPGNLPHLAAATQCEVVILTQECFFAKFSSHPTVRRIEDFCPVRLIKLDDLIVSKDKYGMTLTHALHRGFADLGEGMTECWQVFLNADFILADGSLRSLLKRFVAGARIVAAPSYCTNAEDVIPKLRQLLDPQTRQLSIPPRKLAALVLQHRHKSIQSKTANRPEMHHKFTDQFYWWVNHSTLLGHQMPVSIVGLRPERHLSEPNTYWDYGLIREYCPAADFCVLGDSDDFLMLELRNKDAVDEYLLPGPPDPKELGERMGTWVTHYQRDFARFPLTLHANDLPWDVETARKQLRAYADEILSHAPASLPTHVKHPQWEYHRPNFEQARLKVLAGQPADLGETTAPGIARVAQQATTVGPVDEHAFQQDTAKSPAPEAPEADVKSQIDAPAPLAAAVMESAPSARPSLRGAVKRSVKGAIRRAFNLADLTVVRQQTVPDLLRDIAERESQIAQLVARMQLEEQRTRQEIQGLATTVDQQRLHIHNQQAHAANQESLIKSLQGSIHSLEGQTQNFRDHVVRCEHIISEYQFKLERSYDYQSIMAQDQIRAGMANLEPEFVKLYEQCKAYTMTSWERLYALYKAVHYIVENRIPGDIVECGVWRGGSMQLAAMVLVALGDTERKLYLYDTYEGMTKPEFEIDVDFSGNEATTDWQQAQQKGVKWAYAPVEEVRATMELSRYPMDKVLFVKGPVEATIPGTIPHRIAVLRLDTDWYSSTKHEMQHLYPLLSLAGVLILDDYGHYQGAARGVDEYFAGSEAAPLLQRIDYACRLAVKARP